MLLERLIYPDDFPMHICISTLEEDPIHYHTDIELVYVLRGEIELKNGYYTYHLHAGDVFTNAGNEVHGMCAVTADNVIAQIHISTRDLSQYFPNLSKACYRTYSKKPTDKKHERLRELMLQLLMKYELKDFNYKSECLYLAVDLIKHLDKYFNLFAFDKDVVVGFDRGNSLATERISHICTYIYQNYANNITLQDLSEMEYLSSFYLSHLIKDFTGMNFREFLCFARVEMSEVKLLGSTRKISQIAREVGFSTTAYYRKYFAKWFGHGPQEHRDMYLSEIKSDLHPALFRDLPTGRAIAVVSEAYESQNAQQGTGSVVTSMNLEVDVDPEAKALGSFGRDLRIAVTPADHRALGVDLFSMLKQLAPSRVIVQEEGEDQSAAEQLTHLLEAGGFTVDHHRDSRCGRGRRFAWDSVIAAVYLIGQIAEGREIATEICLRDTDPLDGSLLQGLMAPITARGFRKPSFFAYEVISRMRGEVIARGKQYCVIRNGSNERPSFAVFAYNCSETVRSTCLRNGDLLEIRHTINGFRDEMNLALSLQLQPGNYAVVKYSLNRENNLFANLSALDFRPDAVAPTVGAALLSGSPSVETYMDDVRTVMNINFSLKGLGIQLAIISPCGS